MPDEREKGDYFGASVAISGNTAIVGAPGDQDYGEDAGSAYVFTDTGSGWTRGAKLLPDDPAEDDRFGTSVSISGDFAVIGASGHDGNGESSGVTYVFQDDGSGWAQAAKFAPRDGAPSDQFGGRVSISGVTAVISAEYDDEKGDHSGSAHVFHFPSLDQTPPAVTSVVRADPDPTSAASVDFTVTFSEDVEGVATDDFELMTTGGIPSAQVTAVSPSSGPGTSYTVTVATGTGDGTIRLDVNDDDTITDAAGNSLGGAGMDNGDYSGGEAYTIDTLDPEVTLDAPPTTDDTTPSVTITATDASGLPDGTAVALDVDLNNDGDYDDANELGYTTSTLSGGATTFDIGPPLALGTYPVRARVTDQAGNEGSDTATIEVVAPPVIEGVFFRGSDWKTTFLDELDAQGHGHATIPHLGFANPVGDGSQLDVMPWYSVNQISVVFDQETIVEADDLSVLGVATPSYALDDAAFSRDPVTYTATWSLIAPLPADKLLLVLDSDPATGVRSLDGVALDGEWTNPADKGSDTGDTFPSGDGASGGDFAFRADMHPGNVNGDDRVTFSDFFTIRARLGQEPGTPGYNVIHDLNGDARITFSDAFLSRARLGLRLPAGEPSPPPAPMMETSKAQATAAFDMALLSWVDLDASDEDDSDILTQTLADDLALMLVE